MTVILFQTINLQDFANTTELTMNLIAWIALLVVLIVIIYQGVRFIRKSQRIKEESEGQASFFLGIGLLFISIATSQVIYLFDFISRKVWGSRIFSSGPFEFASVIDRDYFILVFSVLLFSSAFLSYPLEHYILEMKRTILTVTIVISVPLPVIIRLVEYSLGGIITSSSVIYVIFSIFWYGFMVLFVLLLCLLFYLYIQVGWKAPEGSHRMRKSIAIILGLLLWIGTIFLTSTVLKNLNSFETELFRYALPFVLPALLVVSLKLILYGYSTKK